MNVPVRNLVSRRNKYYFRCRFPQCRMPYDVSAIQRYGCENLNGHEKDNPSEIKISLRTSDLKTAVSMCKVMTERFENLVSTGGIYGMTLSEIRKILTAEISRLLEDHARQLADYGEMCATTRREGMEKALSMMKFFERQRDNGCPEGKIAAEQLLKDIPHSESDINFMAREWTLAQIFIMRMQHDCIAGKRALTEYRDAIYDEVMNGDYRSSDEIRLAEQVYTLGELIERFLTEKAPLWGVSLLKLTTADLHTFIAAVILGRIAVAKGDRLGNVGSILGGIVLGVYALVLLLQWIELSGGIKENIKLIGVLLFAIVAIVTLCIEEKKKREAKRHEHTTD